MSQASAPGRPERPPEITATRGRLRRWLWSLAKIVVAVGLLAYLMRSGRLDFGAISSVRLGANLLAMLALIFIALLLPCLRWQWLLRYQGVHVGFLTAVRVTWIGYFFGLFLPGAASGDLAKGYYILKESTHARFHSASTVLVDRGIGLYSLFFLGIVPAGILILRGEASPGVKAIATFTLGLLIASTAGLLALAAIPTRRMLLAAMPERIRGTVDDCLSRYRTQMWGIASCFGLSLVSNASNAVAFVPAARALGVDLPSALSLLVGPLVILANSLPISPGGIGVAESTASSLFSGVGTSHGAEAMLLVRLAIILCTLPGAALYVLHRTRARPAAAD